MNKLYTVSVQYDVNFIVDIAAESAEEAEEKAIAIAHERLKKGEGEEDLAWSEVQDHETVSAWDGSRFVEMEIPPSNERAESEDQTPIAPFHIRDMNDEVLYLTAVGLNRHIEYYATIDLVYSFAQAYANANDETVQIINAHSNSVEAIAPDDID